jgi:tetratricopeptide (TPR) repeat protein
VGYLGYYFAWMLLSYGLRQPWLLVGLGVLWLLRGFIPGPGALFGSLGRARRLRQQVTVNRANVTARRDLATIYLDLLRPRRASELLDEGLALAPEDAELLYLSGLALHRAGQHEQALERLLRAVEKDQRLRHGEPYLVAGNALLALGRWDDAIDGYERFLDFNSSHVAVHTQLARAHVGAKHADAARRALRTGLATWHELPGSMKRRQFGAYLRAQSARITVLKDWRAIAVATLGLVLLFWSARAAYPLVVELWRGDDLEQRMQLSAQRLARGKALCGTQRMGDFQGRYDASFEPPPDLDDYDDLGLSPEQRAEARSYAAKWLETQKQRYENLEISSDRVIFGSAAKEQLCLTRVYERTPELLRGEAILSSDAVDAGARAVDISLRHGQGVVRLSYVDTVLGSTSTVSLRRKP